MHFKISTLFILGLTILTITSCDRKNINENKHGNTFQNQFPIDFAGDEILEYIKPYTLPNGHIVNEETFPLYSLSNKSPDTVWVETFSHKDTTYGNIKNKAIKIICIPYSARHRIKDNQWLTTSPFQFCNDSTKLLPNEKLLFFGGYKGIPDYDSTIFDIRVKIKKGNTIKDTIITRKLILKKQLFYRGHYILEEY